MVFKIFRIPLNKVVSYDSLEKFGDTVLIYISHWEKLNYSMWYSGDTDLVFFYLCVTSADLVNIYEITNKYLTDEVSDFKIGISYSFMYVDTFNFIIYAHFVCQTSTHQGQSCTLVVKKTVGSQDPQLWKRKITSLQMTPT